MIHPPETLTPLPRLRSDPTAGTQSRFRLRLLALPALLLLVVYGPLLAEAARQWMGQDINVADSSAHGFFILPLSLALAWLLRDKIRACAPAPSRAGIGLVALGLLLETGAYLLRLKWFPLLSLVPVLAGLTLALHGPALWRVLRFPILFLVFLAPVPNAVTLPAAAAIQRASTTGAVQGLCLLGVPAVQDGFRIDTPSQSVEVAKTCSVFTKLTTLLVFTTFYGYVFALPWPRRLVLVLAALPVALFANILRIGGLVLIGSAWGERALHAAHDGAEIFVVVLSFVLLTGIGKGLGCREVRFHH